MGYHLPEERTWDATDRILVFLLILAPCALRLWIRVPLDNDTFFLLAHGRYLFEHGFPNVEPFTFHEGLKFVMQQWGTALIFHFMYSLLGYNGLYILTFVCYVLYGFFSYKLSMLLSNDNMPVSATLALVVCVGMVYFIVLRPWLFSGLIILMEVHCLELYLHKKKQIYLVFVLVLSLLLINLHAAVWPIFSIFLFAYILEALFYKGKHEQIQQHILNPLIIYGILTFFMAFINPYFLDAIAYSYYSYGNKYISNFVIEMATPSFKDIRGLLIFFMYTFVAVAYAAYRNGNTRLRYVFLTLLTAYMGLSSARSFQYFLITIPFLAYYFRDFDLLAATNTYKQKADINTYLKVGLLIAFYAIVILGAPRNSEKEFFQSFLPVHAAEYIQKNVDLQNMRLYNDYDTGAYLEFQGIRTFIDSRAEVFLKSNNNKEEILNDYFEVLLGKIHYMDFIKKYRFTHFLVMRGTLMDTYLSRDSAIALLYQDEKYRLLEKVNGQEAALQ